MSQDAGILDKIMGALRLDGWQNVLTSIGIKGKDKRLSAEVIWKRGTREIFNSMYSADDIGGKIVDLVPEQAMTKGYKIIGVEDKAKTDKIMDRVKELQVNEKVLEAAKIARIHGGGGIIKISADAKLDLPMPKNKALLSLSVLDRWDLVVNSTDIDSQITSPTFREPIRYNLQLSEGASAINLPIHASRIVRFDGMYLPRHLMRQNQYWGDSIFTKLENPIRNYQISHDAAALTIQDFDVPVIKMKNLAELMTANCDPQVVKRLEMVNLSKSIAKMIVLDADKEDFDHKSRNVTGMDGLIKKVEDRLVTSTGYPRTVLFGEQAGGLGGNGNHESSNWYDLIENYQENYLKPKLLDIIRYIAMTEFYIDPKTIDLEFNPLWQMSEKEEAEMRKVVAETDAIYIDKGVVDPIEVGTSRFGGDKYSMDTVIEKDLRDVNEIELKPEELPAPKADPTKPIAEKVEKIEAESKKKTDALDQEIKDLRAKMKADLEAKGIVYSFNKDFHFDCDHDVKDVHGKALNLDGYSFKGMFKKDDEVLGEFKVNQNNEMGIISPSITPEDLSKLPHEFNVVIEMTTPQGVTKTIRNAKAKLNE